MIHKLAAARCRLQSLACLLVFIVSAALGEEITTNKYSVAAETGTVYTRTGTVDSEKGFFELSGLKLKVNADVGLMAGIHVPVSKVKGEDIPSGVLRIDVSSGTFPKNVSVTIDGSTGDKRRYANFWARISTEEQYRAFDSLVRSFTWK